MSDKTTAFIMQLALNKRSLSECLSAPSSLQGVT